ncbi:hypothetical protein EON76_04685 [bacterium]|nr:MAG: hypothetical protein EON76_04685 [bacterium]
MSTSPFEQAPNEDPEQFDFETMEFAALANAMSQYEDSQDNYISALADALHSTDPSSKSRKPLLWVSRATEQYVMGFDAVLEAIIDGDESTDSKLAEISAIIKHDAESWNYFKKQVLANTDLNDDEDDDVYIEFDTKECIEELQHDLEELDDLSQLQISLVDGFGYDLQYQYAKLLEKYMKQQAS